MRAPAQRDENEDVDGGIFEEVDGIREQGHGPDPKRHRELDPEIAQVQQRHEPHGPAQCCDIGACG